MNLDDVIVDQIKKSDPKYQARKEAKIKAEEAEAVRKAAEEKSLLGRKEKTFNYQKNTIESSGIREVLGIIVKGLNTSHGYGYSRYDPLKSKLIKMIDKDSHYYVFDSTKYLVNKPYLFNSTENYYGDKENYYLFLQCRDFPHHAHHFFVKFSSKDNKLFLNLEFQYQGFKKYNKVVELSSEKEQMARQIVQSLMDSEVG